MRRLTILSAALAFVLGALSSASAKEFVQFECGQPTQNNNLSRFSAVDATDPNVVTAINAGPPFKTCVGALQTLFALGYKLTSVIPRPFIELGTSSFFKDEGGIVYLLEK